MSGFFTRVAWSAVRRSGVPAGVYYGAAARYHGRRRTSAPHGFPAAAEPFAITWVETDAIVRFSGGPRGPRSTAPAFGVVRGGDWDLEAPSYPEGYLPPRLFHAARFDGSVHFRPMAAHFLEGVPWHETELVHLVGELSAAGPIAWNAYRDRDAALATGAAMDTLFARIRDEGMRPYLDLQRDEPRRRPLMQVLLGEIAVDLGRDGEPLFVDGRHRLTIAKLLGLERVPVVVEQQHVALVRSSRGSSSTIAIGGSGTAIQKSQ